MSVELALRQQSTVFVKNGSVLESVILFKYYRCLWCGMGGLFWQVARGDLRIQTSMFSLKKAYLIV